MCALGKSIMGSFLRIIFDTRKRELGSRGIESMLKHVFQHIVLHMQTYTVAVIHLLA